LTDKRSVYILARIMNTPSTSSEFIDALGGTTAVARLTGSSPQSVANWRARGSIPPSVYLVLAAHAQGAGVRVDPTIFGIRKTQHEAAQ